MGAHLWCLFYYLPPFVWCTQSSLIYIKAVLKAFSMGWAKWQAHWRLCYFLCLGEITRFWILNSHCVFQWRADKGMASFQGSCYPKEDLLLSGPGSSLSLEPGDGSNWTRKQPGKEAWVGLGIVGLHNECHPPLNSRRTGLKDRTKTGQGPIL